MTTTAVGAASTGVAMRPTTRCRHAMRPDSGARWVVRALPSDHAGTDATMSAQPAMEPAGPWAPLGVPTFWALWLAFLVGHIGTWMHDIAASWVMAATTGSLMLVETVQAATTLPTVLLAGTEEQTAELMSI